MATSVHGSYDFYNNGTSYFNGSVLVDDHLSITGTNAELTLSRTSTDQTAGFNITNNQNGGYGSGIVWNSKRTDAGVLTAAEITVSGENAWNTDATSSSMMQFATRKENTLTTHMTIRKSGNVGIGTTGPNQLLTLGSSDGSQVLSFTTSAYLGDNAVIGNIEFSTHGADSGYRQLANIYALKTGSNTNSGSITFWTKQQGGRSEKVRISEDGNVGIGTISPDHALEVVGAISSADAALQKATFANVGNNLVMTANAGASNVDSHIIFKSSQSGGTSAERMRISNLGNVGINTSNPYGGTGVTSMTVNAANYPVISLKRVDGHIFQIFGYYNHTTLNASVGWMQFDAGSSERMRITAGGNVGIGTDSPAALLHLKSTADSVGPSLIFENTNNAQSMNIDYYNNAGAVQSRIQYAEGPASFNFIPNVSNNNSALYIAYDGKVGIGTAAPYGRLELKGNGNSWATAPAIRMWDDTNSKGWLVGTANNITPGDFYIRTLPSISGTPGSTEQEFTIQHGTGNVGIGTTAPIAPLHVAGNAVIETGSPDLYFATTSAAHYNWRLAAQESSDAAFEIGSGTQSAGSNAVNDTYTARLVLNNTGGLSLPTNTWQNSDVLKKYRLGGPSSTTLVRTVNVGTYWDFNARGGCFMFMLHGWQTDSAAGTIHWYNNGSATNVLSAVLLNNFFTPTGLNISVSKGSGDLDIDITLTSTHSNSHGWIFEVWA